MGISQEAKELLIECEKSTKFAATALFPNRFRRPFDPIHDEIFNLIDKEGSQKKAIAVPRGLGKTSICNLLLPAKNILLQDARYIIPVSLSEDSAIEQSENLKNELLSNELIQTLYGDIKGRIWSKKRWIAEVGSQEIMVRPRGAGQQIRGRLFRDYRPDLIVVDDVEDPDDMDTKEQRKKKKQWFFADLVNAVDRASDDWEIIVLGTILHQDSLLQNLLDSPSWDTVELELCDDDFNSNAPNFMSSEEVRELYEEFKKEGELDTFYREYRNDPTVTGEDAAFKPSYFQEYDEKNHNLSRNPDVENLILVDPSRSSDQGANPTGIVGVGINMSNQQVFVRECVSKHLAPPEMYDRIREMVHRIDADVIGVEITGLHEFILHPLKTFLRKRNVSIPIIELQARGGRHERGKAERVRSLIDFYSEKVIWHNKDGNCQELESQLLSFPSSKEWSLMDPFGYLPEILEKGDRYLSPTPGPTEFNESRRDVEKEFRELREQYNEPPLEGHRVFE